VSLLRRVEWTPPNGVAVALALALAGVHLYLGLAAGGVSPADAEAFTVVGVAFLLGTALYLTRFWRPVLYLGAVLAVMWLAVVWALGGMRYRGAGLVTLALGAGFVAVSMYLFVHEERAVRD
jgi:hypothetical protein